MPQMSQVLMVCAIGMLTAGLSTRDVSCEVNVHFSTISRLQRCFRQFGSTSNRPHNRRPRVTMCNHTSPGPPHPACSLPRSSETSHPVSCCNNRFAEPKNFCTNCQKPSQGSSSICSHSMVSGTLESDGQPSLPLHHRCASHTIDIISTYDEIFNFQCREQGCV